MVMVTLRVWKLSYCTSYYYINTIGCIVEELHNSTGSLLFCLKTEKLGMVIALDVDFSMEVQRSWPDMNYQFTLNATVIFSEASRDVIGTGLWKLSMYESNTNGSFGEHGNRIAQVLPTSEQSKPLIQGRPLKFVNLRGQFDISAIGCDREYRYLCVDFTKGERPVPDFKFTSLQADETKITACVDRCPDKEGKIII